MALGEAAAGVAATSRGVSLGVCPQAETLKPSAHTKNHWDPIRCMLFLCGPVCHHKAQGVPPNGRAPHRRRHHHSHPHATATCTLDKRAFTPHLSDAPGICPQCGPVATRCACAGAAPAVVLSTRSRRAERGVPGFKPCWICAVQITPRDGPSASVRAQGSCSVSGTLTRTCSRSRPWQQWLRPGSHPLRA